MYIAIIVIFLFIFILFYDFISLSEDLFDALANSDKSKYKRKREHKELHIKDELNEEETSESLETHTEELIIEEPKIKKVEEKKLSKTQEEHTDYEDFLNNFSQKFISVLDDNIVKLLQFKIDTVGNKTD